MEASWATQGRDRKSRYCNHHGFAVFIAFAIVEIHPWGTEPSKAESFEAYWHGVASASDFVSFWTGASLVRQGAGSSLYDMKRQHEFQIALRVDRFSSPRLVERLDPYHNPPPMALLFLPLTALPLSWAFLAWAALSVGGFVAAVFVPTSNLVSPWTPIALMLATGAVADSLLGVRLTGYSWWS